MAREIEKLTRKLIADRMAKRPIEPGLLPDGLGLSLRITRAGTAAWVVRYMLRGRAHEKGLGALHTVDISEARKRAKAVRLEVSAGRDPLANKGRVRHTFREAAGAYIADKSPGWTNAVHTEQWTNTLAQHVMPGLGQMDVAEITTEDVLRVVRPIWTKIPETASRVLGRIEAILGYSTVSGWRSADLPNPAKWTGLLEHVLPRKPKAEGHANMPPADVPAFLAKLAQSGGIAAKCLRFLILTGARSMEARGATWAEIDLDAREWRVPQARMKMGEPHRVPLSDGALALLAEAAELRQSDGPDALIFPGASGAKPLSDVALSKLVPAGVTVHGFRSSLRLWAAEIADPPFDKDTIEATLAHKLGDAVQQAYDRGTRLPLRIKLMQGWADYATGVSKG